MEQRTVVVVDGRGPVADETAAQLRRVGVCVRAGVQAVDAAELEAAAGGVLPGALVLVAEDERPAWAGTPSMLAPWHTAGVAHLPVVAAGGGVVVGPLVAPGRSPCLACVAVPSPSPSAGPASAQVGAGAVVLAAAVATVTVLAALRGEVSVAGISTEIGPGGTTVLHRVWTSRSGCRCASVRMAG